MRPARPKADSGRPWPQNYECACELGSIFAHELNNRLGEQASCGGRESDQDYTWRVYAGGEYEPTEVLVFGQEYPVLGQCKLHYLLVDGTLLEFAYSEDIVTVCA
jgi:hypothetical protein